MESHVFIDKVDQLLQPAVHDRMENQRQGVSNDSILRVNLHRTFRSWIQNPEINVASEYKNPVGCMSSKIEKPEESPQFWCADHYRMTWSCIPGDGKGCPDINDLDGAFEKCQRCLWEHLFTTSGEATSGLQFSRTEAVYFIDSKKVWQVMTKVL